VGRRLRSAVRVDRINLATAGSYFAMKPAICEGARGVSVM
jgi:hypothetical protein